MTKKENYNQAKDTLGYDEKEFDDASEAFKWNKHTYEERERLIESKDLIDSYINQLNVYILEPDYLDLLTQIYTTYPKYDNMCICISPQIIGFDQESKISYNGEIYELKEGIELLCEKIVSLNNNIISFENHHRYNTHYVLNVKNIN